MFRREAAEDRAGQDVHRGHRRRSDRRWSREREQQVTRRIRVSGRQRQRSSSVRPYRCHSQPASSSGGLNSRPVRDGASDTSHRHRVRTCTRRHADSRRWPTSPLARAQPYRFGTRATRRPAERASDADASSEGHLSPRKLGVSNVARLVQAASTPRKERTRWNRWRPT